jgi:hypothetical protein
MPAAVLVARKFDALRAKMTPAVRARAAERARTMLAEMPAQATEVDSDDRIRELGG